MPRVHPMCAAMANPATPTTAAVAGSSPCSASFSHNSIQRGMCEACFLWNARDEIKAAQDAGWRELRAEWRNHHGNANDYHFQLRGISPDGDMEDVPDELPNAPMQPPYSPVCALCGNVATCFGQYADYDKGFACDSCCGHGNEDGWCMTIGEYEPPNAATADKPHMRQVTLREYRDGTKAGKQLLWWTSRDEPNRLSYTGRTAVVEVPE